MISELVKDKVQYRFFDKSFKESNHFYTATPRNNHGHPKEVIEDNCGAIVKALGAIGLVTLQQVHGNHVHYATEASSFGNEPIADATVTNIPGLALAIQTADCVPVLFSCKSGKVIGAAHCGWKSAKANIIDNVVKRMRELGAENIEIVIGPSIQHNSYEVDDDYRSAFLSEDSDVERLFLKSPYTEGRWIFDLPGFVHHKSVAAGLGLYHKSTDDTYSMEDKYHSYRRQCHRGETYRGHLLSTIMITQK